MKVKRNEAVELFTELGYAVADKWDDVRLAARLKKVGTLVGPDVELSEEMTKRLNSYTANHGGEFEIGGGDSEEVEANPAKKAKAKSKPAAKSAKEVAPAKKAAKKAAESKPESPDKKSAKTKAEVPAKKAGKAKAVATEDKKPAAKKPGVASQSDAIVTVLTSAGKPMTIEEIIAAIDKKNLWKNKEGVTPGPSIRSVIMHDVIKPEPIFKRVERGTYDLV